MQFLDWNYTFFPRFRSLCETRGDGQGYHHQHHATGGGGLHGGVADHHRGHKWRLRKTSCPEPPVHWSSVCNDLVASYIHNGSTPRPSRLLNTKDLQMTSSTVVASKLITFAGKAVTLHSSEISRLQDHPHCGVVCGPHHTVRPAPALKVQKCPHPRSFRIVHLNPNLEKKIEKKIGNFFFQIFFWFFSN